MPAKKAKPRQPAFTQTSTKVPRSYWFRSWEPLGTYRSVSIIATPDGLVEVDMYSCHNPDLVETRMTFISGDHRYVRRWRRVFSDVTLLRFATVFADSVPA